MSFLDNVWDVGGETDPGAALSLTVDDVPTPDDGIKIFYDPASGKLYYKHADGRVVEVAPDNTIDVGRFVPAGEVLTPDNFVYALTAAIAYADALPRSGAVRLPPGDWYMDPDEVYLPGHGYTKPGVRLIGAGRDVTRLIWPATYTGHCIVMDGYQDDPAGFATKAFWYGGLFDLTVYCAYDNGRACGVYLRQSIWTPIVRVAVRGFGNPENDGVTRGVGIWYDYGAAVGEGNHQHPCIFDSFAGGCTTGLRIDYAFPANFYKLELNQNRFCDVLLGGHGGSIALQMDGGMFQSNGSGDAASPYYGNPFYSVRQFGLQLRSGVGATFSTPVDGIVTVGGLTGCTAADAGRTVLTSGGVAKECGLFLITEFVDANTLKIRKEHSDGATGLSWAVHQNDGDTYARIEGTVYHEGTMGGVVLARKVANAEQHYHLDGMAIHNLPLLADLEHVHVFTARRLIGYAPTTWIRAAFCKRLLLEVAETPESDPDKFDLDISSAGALTVIGRTTVSSPCTSPYSWEAMLARRASEAFDAGAGITLAGDGTLSALLGLKGSTANATTNRPAYIGNHPRLGGRAAVALRNASTRNMHGTFATPIPVGSLPSIIMAAHLPAGANSGIGDRRGPTARDNGTGYNHLGIGCIDAWGDATGVKAMWRDPNGGSLLTLRRDVDLTSGRILIVGTWLAYSQLETVYVSAIDSVAGESNAPATDWHNLYRIVAAMTHFQFSGEAGSPTTSANDLDLGFVAWLHTPLHPDELAPTMAALKARWGHDTAPLALAGQYTPIGLNGQVIMVDLSSANQTVNLPAGHKRGDRIDIQVSTAAGGHTCTIDPAGSETINGAGTLVLSADYDGAELWSDGTNWIRRKR